MRARDSLASAVLGLALLLAAPAAALAAPLGGDSPSNTGTVSVAQIAAEQRQSYRTPALAPAALRDGAGVSVTVRPAVMLPTSGPITDDFGPRISPTAGASSDHQGIDLAPGAGTPIVAAADGVVTAMQPVDNGGLGVHVIVEHPGLGVRTVYGHALTRSIAVEVGQQVQAGTQIASVGNTGTSTGAHLHFEVRDLATGAASDPVAWLAGHGVGL
ncbi:M23 family metallopeptidase [Pseudoclavibacter sp. AY1F1]|uniref:M23 family metallopeptidase n=1 Tax=Pseudoclavibacter sp. AY1F1 TaxID=2080583 RepID=UPI0015E2FEA9|nr:M23 family metallopeptidase [Pseudoclavibacter sp. AY1F1]